MNSESDASLPSEARQLAPARVLGLILAILFGGLCLCFGSGAWSLYSTYAACRDAGPPLDVLVDLSAAGVTKCTLSNTCNPMYGQAVRWELDGETNEGEMEGIDVEDLEAEIVFQKIRRGSDVVIELPPRIFVRGSYNRWNYGWVRDLDRIPIGEYNVEVSVRAPARELAGRPVRLFTRYHAGVEESLALGFGLIGFVCGFISLTALGCCYAGLRKFGVWKQTS